MDNYIVAWYLKQIAILKELQGETDFKIIAYRKAAHTLEGLRESIRDLPKHRLAQLPGIGAKILALIEEYLETGSIKKYIALMEATPKDFLTMLKIPGMGPKSIRLIHKHLGITTLSELEAAIKARKVRKIPGIGAKFEMRVASGIQHMSEPPSEFTLGSVLPLSRIIVDVFQQQPMVHRVSVAGDVRRMKDTIEQLIIVISCENVQALKETILSLPVVHRVIEERESECIVYLQYHVYLPVHFVLTKPDQYIATLHEWTGSQEYLQYIKKVASDKKIDLNGDWESEEQLFESLGILNVPPELRELAFVDAIDKNELPNLVQLSDIKGDLHMHSHYSDGIHSVEEMASKALELGYEYIAITDHSQSLKVAKGLSIEQWRRQKKEIEQLNKKLKDFHIFSGTEMDILTDARLDFDDEFLKDVDVVVASIHTGFQQDKQRQTEKLLNALDNPYVDIVAHPTGRMIARRPGYEIDFDAVFRRAKETLTCMEINSSPDRLDLNAENARKAVREYGLMISINTDAHDKEALHDMELGVSVARRAGLEAKDILNTKNRQDLIQYI